MIRVAFFSALEFHAPILAPVRAALTDRADTLLTADRRAIVGFHPHVLVMGFFSHLEFFRRTLPESFIVNIRHGMIGKGGLHRLPQRASARRFDAVAVGDRVRIADYERSGARPGVFWETGYPQLDPLFRRVPAPPLPIDPDRPTLLYAPTWNLGLTSVTMLGDRLIELVRARAPGLNVIIKPHPVIGDWRPQWMARWARMAATHSGVHLVADTHVDIVPYLLASDVLLSDASSVIFEFLALDRPVIAVNNPLRTADPAWYPEDIVWRWRDLAQEVYEARELPAAVEIALHNPSARQERRQAYARQLFGRFTDGRNAERIAERILDAGARVVRGEHPPAPPPPRGASRWHDLRTRLREHTIGRRLLIGPLEPLRLRLRARRLADRSVARALEGDR
jgi:CDP-Glycerol:Poly(glycerophosphate) glycerophosphotransferase